MNTGGPAFPGTLLDWFAGQALAGLVSESGRYDAAGAALDAYDLAAAMLAEKARREALVQESSTTDHSGEAGKMVELEAQNRELLERIKRLEDAGGKMAELLDCYAGFNETEEWACSTRSQHIKDTRIATEMWAKAKGQP